MNISMFAVTLFTLSQSLVLAQGEKGLDLARLLASGGTQQNAIAMIQKQGNEITPSLISWAQHPPATINEYELNVGLADAFGLLKTSEAIPFLIKNISLYRQPHLASTWLKTPSVIEQRMPAVAALIQIGPEASRAVIGVYSSGHMSAEDRLSAIFVVSQIQGVPEAQAFLATISALSQVSLERYWAKEGLKVFEEVSDPKNQE